MFGTMPRWSRCGANRSRCWASRTRPVPVPQVVAVNRPVLPAHAQFPGNGLNTPRYMALCSPKVVFTGCATPKRPMPMPWPIPLPCTGGALIVCGSSPIRASVVLSSMNGSGMPRRCLQCVAQRWLPSARWRARPYSQQEYSENDIKLMKWQNLVVDIGSVQRNFTRHKDKKQVSTQCSSARPPCGGQRGGGGGVTCRDGLSPLRDPPIHTSGDQWATTDLGPTPGKLFRPLWTEAQNCFPHVPPVPPQFPPHLWWTVNPPTCVSSNAQNEMGEFKNAPQT